MRRYHNFAYDVIQRRGRKVRNINGMEMIQTRQWQAHNCLSKIPNRKVHISSCTQGHILCWEIRKQNKRQDMRTDNIKKYIYTQIDSGWFPVIRV